MPAYFYRKPASNRRMEGAFDKNQREYDIDGQ
jgi:hypothetical protein